MILYNYFSKIKNVKFPPAYVVTVTTVEVLSTGNISILYDVGMDK